MEASSDGRPVGAGGELLLAGTNPLQLEQALWPFRHTRTLCWLLLQIFEQEKYSSAVPSKVTVTPELGAATAKLVAPEKLHSSYLALVGSWKRLWYSCEARRAQF